MKRKFPPKVGVSIDAIVELLIDGFKSPTSEVRLTGRRAIIGEAACAMHLATKTIDGVKLTDEGNEFGRRLNFDFEVIKQMARDRANFELFPRRSLSRAAYKRWQESCENFEIKQRNAIIARLNEEIKK